jgi:hypothetical protein
MKNSITKFADASIAGLASVVGGKGKCKKSKSKSGSKSGSKKSGSKKSGSKKSGSKGGGYCPPAPCW